MSSTRRVAVADLQTWMKNVFIGTGMPQHLAENSAEVLTYASRSGIDSHGILALPRYVEHLVAGRLQAAAKPQPLIDENAAVLVDGCRALGIAVGPSAMRSAITKAKHYGIGLAIVRNSSHFGAAGYYTHLAAAHGAIGISTSNVEAMMPAFGGVEKRLGNNPLSIGAPARDGGVHQIDFCTSEVAWGKLQMAAEQGASIPETWATDSDGVPTTDPRIGMEGMLVPLAGHKGSGLAFMLEVLSSVLAGAPPGHAITQEVGLSQCHVAINIAAIRPLDAFTHDATALAAKLRSSKPVNPDQTVLAPGDPEALATAHRLEHGIEISSYVETAMIGLSKRYNLAMPYVENRSNA